MSKSSQNAKIPSSFKIHNCITYLPVSKFAQANDDAIVTMSKLFERRFEFSAIAEIPFLCLPFFS